MAARSVKLLRKQRVTIGVLAAFLAVGAFGAWEWQSARTEKAAVAAREAQIQGLMDNLESHLDSGNGGEQQIRDLFKFKKALDTDFAAAVASNPAPNPERTALLDRGIRYLDRLRVSAARDPQLAAEVATTYQQLGFFQQRTEDSSAAGRQAALKTYQKAASVLGDIASAHPDDPSAQQKIAVVSQRIRELGGNAPAPLEPGPSSAPPAPAASDAKSLPRESTSQPKRVAGVPRVQPQPVAPGTPSPAVTPAPAPPVAAAPAAAAPAVSAALEDRLISVTSRVQTAEQAIEPYRQSLNREGQTLSADTASTLSLMRANLERAKREMAAGNEAAAMQSLSSAEAFANKLLRLLNR
jgi:hypothetical protein